MSFNTKIRKNFLPEQSAVIASIISLVVILFRYVKFSSKSKYC